MKKKVSLFLTCGISLFFAIPIAQVVSINNTKTTANFSHQSSPTDAIDFIKDRSFSVGGSNSENACFGTMWMYSHIEDYKYNCFTNWHVEYGCNEELHATNYRFWSDGIGLLNPSSFSNYRTFTLKWNHVATYKIDGSIRYGLDVASASVDFSTCVDALPLLKQKLDLLNDYADNHENELIQTIDSSLITKNTELYLGGYPCQNVWGNGWDNNLITKWNAVSKFKLNQENPTLHQSWRYDNSFSENTVNHDIGDKIKSIANTFNSSYVDKISTDPIDLELMKHGAGGSGSMLVCIDENQEICVAGIYWGGFLYSDQHSGLTIGFQCSFEQFNSTNNYNVVKDCEDGKWENAKIIEHSMLLIVLIVCILSTILIVVIIFTVIKHNKNKKNVKQAH